jgi:hypothetical protein
VLVEELFEEVVPAGAPTLDLNEICWGEDRAEETQVEDVRASALHVR